MSDIVFRPYISADLSACPAIFDSNVPTFFAPEECIKSSEDLKGVNSMVAPYLVLIRDGAVVACGGLTIGRDQRQASLSWGMVDSTFHGLKLGTYLMRARLALARSIPGLAKVVLSASQHTQGFYERFGFTVLKITPDGFGPALDRWDMALRL